MLTNNYHKKYIFINNTYIINIIEGILRQFKFPLDPVRRNYYYIIEYINKATFNQFV